MSDGKGRHDACPYGDLNYHAMLPGPGRPVMSFDEKTTRAQAFRHFMDKFGHEHIDIACLITPDDKVQYNRYKLRDFLKEPSDD